MMASGGVCRGSPNYAVFDPQGEFCGNRVTQLANSDAESWDEAAAVLGRSWWDQDGII